VGGDLGPLIERAGIVHAPIHDPEHQSADCVDQDDGHRRRAAGSSGPRDQARHTLEPVPDAGPRSPQQLLHRGCSLRILPVHPNECRCPKRHCPASQLHSACHGPSYASASEGIRVSREKSRKRTPYPKDSGTLATSVTRREALRSYQPRRPARPHPSSRNGPGAPCRCTEPGPELTKRPAGAPRPAPCGSSRDHHHR
jgi:hypothetical protein